MRRKRVLWSLANLLSGVVIVRLIVDPTRPLLPIFILLGLAVVPMALPAVLPPRE